MGNLRSAPLKDKDTHNHEGRGLLSGLTGMQGLRRTMEDAHTAVHELPKSKCSMFGVFDGHAGSEAAIKCAEVLPGAFDEALAGVDLGDVEAVKKAITDAILHFDKTLEVSDDSGCTAIMVLVTDTHIITANVGDSRAILSRGQVATALSFDHKPTNPEETKRIEACGGVVVQGRVNAQLAVSRALGDFRYKMTPDVEPTAQLVSPEPEFTVTERKEDIEFVILACDGVWDVMSNQEVVDFVFDVGEQDAAGSWGRAAEMLVDNALDKGSTDNISALIIAFDSAPKLTPRARSEGNPGDDAGGKVEDDERRVDSCDPVPLSEVPTWTDLVEDLVALDKFMPGLAASRARASRTVTVPAELGAPGTVSLDMSEAENARTFEPNPAWNEIMGVYSGVNRGDLLRLFVDVAVVPANGTLVGTGGGLYGRTHKLAGPRLRAELQEHGELSFGEAVLSQGYDLPAQHLVHAVIQKSDRGAKAVAACVSHALYLATSHGLSSIAFPPLGAAEAGMNIAVSAKTLAETVRIYLDNTPDHGLTRVIFCAITAPASDAFEAAMRVVFPPVPEAPRRTRARPGAADLDDAPEPTESGGSPPADSAESCTDDGGPEEDETNPQ